MIRIDRFLSNLKYGSRDEIKKIMKNKKIIINGKCISDASFKVDPEKDIIVINNEKVFYKSEISLMMNKPAGYLCASFDKRDKTILDLLKEPYNRLDFKIIGRLDKDTEGLILLTTNSSLVHKYTSPKKEIFKKYYCLLKNNFNEKEQLENGVIIKDKGGKDFLTKPAIIEIINEKEVFIQISEGKYHEVKRIFESVNNKVIYLKRIQIGDIILDKSLKKGEYKEINLS